MRPSVNPRKITDRSTRFTFISTVHQIINRGEGHLKVGRRSDFTITIDRLLSIDIIDCSPMLSFQGGKRVLCRLLDRCDTNKHCRSLCLLLSIDIIDFVQSWSVKKTTLKTTALRSDFTVVGNYRLSNRYRSIQFLSSGDDLKLESGGYDSRWAEEHVMTINCLFVTGQYYWFSTRTSSTMWKTHEYVWPVNTAHNKWVISIG